MTFAIQRCTRCGELENDHAGPPDRYLCPTCRRAGWRVAGGGSLYQTELYLVHVWHPGASVWNRMDPPIEAGEARTAYLAAQQRHPGLTVHVARVLDEPCSPGAPHA